MRTSLPTFAAGALAATLLAVPAAAALTAVAAPDPHPTTFDGTSPTLTLSPVEFVTGASIDAAPAADPAVCSMANISIPLRMRWSGADPTSGLGGYDLWGTGPGFGGNDKILADTTATSYRYTGGNYNGDCGGGSTAFQDEFWVVAKDHRGNTAATHRVDELLDVWQETGAPLNGQPALPVTRTGTWRTATCTCFNNGTTLYSTTAGASLSYRVGATNPGQNVAVVMEKAANRGSVKISVDGGTATPVSTYAATTSHRVIVWQRTLGVGTHTIRLTNAGTAGHPRIDVDTLMLTPGPTSESPEEPPQGLP